MYPYLMYMEVIKFRINLKSKGSRQCLIKIKLFFLLKYSVRYSMHVNECLEFYMYETQNETITSTYSMILFIYPFEFFNDNNKNI